MKRACLLTTAAGPLLSTCAVVAILGGAAQAQAAGFTELGEDIEARGESVVEVSGDFRARGEALYNLDLDRGLTPSGQALYAVPLSGEGQWLRQADMRLRTDVAAYAPVGTAAVKLRVDLLDNLALGSSAQGPPQSTVTQGGEQKLLVRRAYGEVLTPFGLVSAGRMGSQWGLGMLTNSGDCADCDSGDAADRLGFVTPIGGLVWALAYDIAWAGPQGAHRASSRTVDLEPADDVRGVTFAVMKYRSPMVHDRRLRAGRATWDWGAYASWRWQDRDVPAFYVPSSEAVALGPSQVVRRDNRALALDFWTGVTHPWFRVGAEFAVLRARLGQPSLVPGVDLVDSVDALQWGFAVQSEVHREAWPVAFGLDLGVASGDAAPGFGAFVGPYDPPAKPGDLDGPQFSIPGDREIRNFRFHPDFRVDRILFREIVGTVTDAAYVRPHARLRLAEWGPGTLVAGVAVVGSWAMEAASTPSGARDLGWEVDPTLSYDHAGGFSLALEHAALFPGKAWDNAAQNLAATSAQSLRLRMTVGF